MNENREGKEISLATVALVHLVVLRVVVASMAWELLHDDYLCDPEHTCTIIVHTKRNVQNLLGHKVLREIFHLHVKR